MLQPPRYEFDIRSHRDPRAPGIAFTVDVGLASLTARTPASPTTGAILPADGDSAATVLASFIHGILGLPAECTPGTNRAYDFGYLAGAQQAG